MGCICFKGGNDSAVGVGNQQFDSLGETDDPEEERDDTARGGNKIPALDELTDEIEDAEVVWACKDRGMGCPMPTISHATGSRVVKGEDVMFVHHLGISSQPQSTLLMVCDGHSGIDTARFVATHFLRLLNAKLPQKLPDFSVAADVEVFAENLRKALCQTFFHLDNEWSLSGLNSGCTCTVALVTGWLITVANVGDSSAVLDTGASVLELTKSHRLHESLEEQARLRAAGVELAPLGFHLQGPAKPGEIGVGPLRMWPGGLCVARSVGDLDAGPEVMPLPNIRQVLIPTNGCRVIMASDGLWDVVTLSKACKLTRSKTTADAAAALMTAVSRDLRIMDDTSVVVVDALPPDVAGWPSVVLKAERPGGGGGGSLSGSAGMICACFRGDNEEPDSRDVCGSGHVSYLADVDTLKAFPSLKAMLNRTMIHNSYHMPPNGGQDFTQHGVAPWRPGAPPLSTKPAALDRSNSGGGSSSGSGHHRRVQVSMVRDSTMSLNRVMSNPQPVGGLHHHRGLSHLSSEDASRRYSDAAQQQLPGGSSGEALYGADVRGSNAAAAILQIARQIDSSNGSGRGGGAAAAALAAAAAAAAAMGAAGAQGSSMSPQASLSRDSGSMHGSSSHGGGGGSLLRSGSGRAAPPPFVLLDAESVLNIETSRPPVRMQSRAPREYHSSPKVSASFGAMAPMVRAPSIDE